MNSSTFNVKKVLKNKQLYDKYCLICVFLVTMQIVCLITSKY